MPRKARIRQGRGPQEKSVIRTRCAGPAVLTASWPACMAPRMRWTLKSSVALVIDQDTQEVLFSKNDSGGAAHCLADQADDGPDHQ
jgi:D-alanyl-D-alanine carboxypeptidase